MIKSILNIYRQLFKLETTVITVIFFIVSREDAEEQYQHALEMLKNIRPDKNEE